ncbi:hypothetical protein [Nocardioides sp. CFH 31398]|uniref:hypothetical protein n=1 Tax=Nocardioides sp. CFH 31398 TaxID=2919579 RepID=UPI001F05545C|nr:hypothetical protein [Nocardioides sp. CFH 31398]MCH1867091.1 hypothetical protein [Nocardioides sp. CFH 31398]
MGTREVGRYEPEFYPRHVWLVDEATNSRKPPLIALLLELRRIENDGPAHARAAEPHWRGLVAVAYPGGGMRVWWERTEVLIPFEAWPAPC